MCPPAFLGWTWCLYTHKLDSGNDNNNPEESGTHRIYKGGTHDEENP